MRHSKLLESHHPNPPSAYRSPWWSLGSIRLGRRYKTTTKTAKYNT